MMGTVFFDLAALVTLVGAVMVLVLPNQLRAAMALILSLGGLALVFLLLHAEFVAVMQVLVYAGAIMVLFVFVIMLLNLSNTQISRLTPFFVVGAVVVLGAISYALALVVHAGSLSFAKAGEAANVVHALPRDFGSVEQIGKLIMTELVLPFEMLSLLLLVAILGAVVIAKRRI